MPNTHTRGLAMASRVHSQCGTARLCGHTHCCGGPLTAPVPQGPPPAMATRYSNHYTDPATHHTSRGPRRAGPVDLCINPPPTRCAAWRRCSPAAHHLDLVGASTGTFQMHMSPSPSPDTSVPLGPATSTRTGDSWPYRGSPIGSRRAAFHLRTSCTEKRTTREARTMQRQQQTQQARFSRHTGNISVSGPAWCCQVWAASPLSRRSPPKALPLRRTPTHQSHRRLLGQAHTLRPRFPAAHFFVQALLRDPPQVPPHNRPQTPLPPKHTETTTHLVVATRVQHAVGTKRQAVHLVAAVRSLDRHHQLKRVSRPRLRVWASGCGRVWASGWGGAGGGAWVCVSDRV